MKVILAYLRRPLEANSTTASTALNSAHMFEAYERGEKLRPQHFISGTMAAVLGPF
jgi:hypothetical protein